jgi:5'-phosphate synthase pdxT subunit
MIMLSTTAHDAKKGGQNLLGALDITVQRNAFGPQTESFITSIAVDGIANPETLFPGVFIRAPVVENAAEHVQILARVDGHHGHVQGNRIVAVRQQHLLGTSFHPELTQDDRIHRYFLNMVREYSAKGA